MKGVWVYFQVLRHQIKLKQPPKTMIHLIKAVKNMSIEENAEFAKPYLKAVLQHEDVFGKVYGSTWAFPCFACNPQLKTGYSSIYLVVQASNAEILTCMYKPDYTGGYYTGEYKLAPYYRRVLGKVWRGIVLPRRNDYMDEECFGVPKRLVIHDVKDDKAVEETRGVLDSLFVDEVEVDAVKLIKDVRRNDKE